MEKRVIPNDILLSAAGDLLAEGRDVTLLAKGNSMLPFLRSEKDSVTLHRRESVAVGDIVLAHLGGGRYVLHRVFEIEGDKVTLMGDGNLRGTEQCLSGDVLGTVKCFVRPDGTCVEPGDGHIWRRLLPIRRYLLFIYRKIHRLK